jgi:predicted AlkP superfamily phosphohydrolase/phosphomutase
MKPRILIIGLDGATFDVINPLIERGLLPNIGKLIRNGVHGELQSTIHPITPQAWSTFLTGKNAGKHGIFDFTIRKKDSYDIEFINASRRSGESIFLYLSRKGLRVGSIAVPFTYPPEKVNGFMLSGLDTPAEDERSVYPLEIFEEIRKRFGNYYIHLASPVGRSNNEEKFWKDIQTEDMNRTDISLYLMERYPCDFFMTAYNNTDRVQHQYLTYEFLEALRNGKLELLRKNLLIKTYENLDREIGRLLEKINEDTLIILMSDHGSGPIRRVFYLNRWLEENGFFKYRKTTGMGLNLLENARFKAKRLLPRSAKGFIKRFFPQVRDSIESYRYFSGIDWSKTMAYGFGMYGNIFINLKDREPQGAVPIKDFGRVCQEIAGKLSELKDPDTGEKLIDRVYGKDELYEGPFIGNAPDLIIRWRDYSYYTSNNPGRENGSYFGKFLKIDSSDFDHVGTHRINGVLIASGKHVQRGAILNGANIADIAPTILFALEQPIPEEMDGKVLFDIFTEDFLKERIPQYIPSESDSSMVAQHVNYTDKEAKDVEKRLKGLGYL